MRIPVAWALARAKHELQLKEIQKQGWSIFFERFRQSKRRLARAEAHATKM